MGACCDRVSVLEPAAVPLPGALDGDPLQTLESEGFQVSSALRAELIAHLQEVTKNRDKLQQALADLRQNQTLLEIRIDETKDKGERERLRVLLDRVVAQILQYEMIP